MRIQMAMVTCLLVLLSCGCVERRLTLVTQPQGAVAYYNGEQIGQTPVTFSFTHYQAADLRFEKDGFDTLRLVQPLKVPAWQRFPLDIFSELLWPFTLRDEQAFAYTMEQTQDLPADGLLQEAQGARERATGGLSLAAPD